MIAKIYPSKAQGMVMSPPSKSMAHRYIICAALSEGVSKISNIAYSDDICATLGIAEALGAKIERQKDYVIIEGADFGNVAENTEFFARESGSTLRFFIPIAYLSDKRLTFKGAERLFERPLEVYEKIAAEKGFLFEKGSNSLTLCGKLKGGVYRIEENKSSQFVSGLLLALSKISENCEIRLSQRAESRAYIDMTIMALRQFGIAVECPDELTFKICAGQKYCPRELTVEGDYSNGAFFDALNYVGGQVEVLGLSRDTLQSDAVYSGYFEKIKKGSPTLDITDCPDLAPILLALMAECGGGRLVGTRRLAYKESNRGEAMRDELSKFGAKIVCFEDEIIVERTPLRTPHAKISSHGDHRIVMACAVLMTKYGGEIEEAENVNKSMPEFFQRLSALSVKVELE